MAGFLLFPSAYYDSAFAIDYKKLKEKGYKALIFDIDNTLTMHNVKGKKREAKFFEYLHELGFKTVVMSNNSKERVAPFAHMIGTEYIARAHKPKAHAYKKAMNMMNSTVEDTVFIGDQLFTDILGANRVGVNSVLVKPISSKEAIWIKLKRLIEKPLVFVYELKHDKNNITF